MALTKVTGQVIKDTTDVTVGVLTVTNTLAVGGTVSIGGTLTYEDVTNIDAVGLITARNGIVVGSGITLGKDGDIFATGISTFSEGLAGDVIIDDKIVHRGDTDTAIRFPDNNQISFETGGTQHMIIGTGGAISITDTIQHIGDTNTKIRFPEADHISMETGGVQRLRIKGNGNIGIGTTDPNNRIHVYDGKIKAQASTDDTSTNLDLIRAQCGSTGNALFAIRAADAADNNSDWDIKTNADEELSFTIGAGTEKARITSDGKVGIGTSVPASRLDVRDTSALGIISRSATTQATDSNKALKVRNNSTTDVFAVSYKGLTEIARGELGTYLKVGGDDASNGRALTFTSSDTASVGALHTLDAISGNGAIALATNGNERLRVDSSGLLVSTTGQANGIRLVDSSASSGSPNLEIISKRQDSNVNTAFAANIFLGRNRTDQKIVDNTFLGSICFGGNHTDGTVGNISYGAAISARSSGDFNSKTDLPTDLIFSTGTSGTDRDGETAGNSNVGTERARITRDGDFRIAQSSTSSPAQTGTTGFALNSTGRLEIAGGNQIAVVVNRTNTGDIMQFRRNALVKGEININASRVAYNTESDYRLKENITTLSNGITRLKTLKPSRFNFKEDPNNTIDGFIAHELQTVVPEAVSGTKDQVDSDNNPVYQGADASLVVPLLTAALQEAVAKIETLESEVAALKSS